VQHIIVMQSRNKADRILLLPSHLLRTLSSLYNHQCWFSRYSGWRSSVVPKLVWAVTEIKVAIMSHNHQYFAVISHLTEQHCGFCSALPP